MVEVYEHRGVTVFQGRVSMLGLGSLKTCNFLWDGSLIDAGPSRLNRVLSSHFRSRRIDRVLLTHFHEDHTGNAAWLQREKGIPAYISPRSLEVCRRDAGLPLYRRYFWGKRPAFDPLPLGETVFSEKSRLEVINVPGHSHDHVCFLDREKGCVFTGDLFVTPKTRIVMRHESIPRIIISIERLLEEDFDILYCAHAGVVEDGHRIMAKKLDYLKELREGVLDLRRQGMTVGEIDKKIFKRPLPLTFISSGEWSSRHIISSIVEDSGAGVN